MRIGQQDLNVSLNKMGGVHQSIDTPEGAFGPDLRGMTKAAIDVSDQVDEYVAKKAYSEFSERVSFLLEDPEKGMLYTKGEDAIGLSQKYDENVRAIYNEYADNLSPNSLGLFDGFAGPVLRAGMENVRGHEGKVIRELKTANNQAAFKASASNYLGSIGTEAESDAFGRMSASARLILENQGLSPESPSYKQGLMEVYDTAAKGAVERYLINDNPRGALKYVEGKEALGVISSGAAAELKDKISNDADILWVQQQADAMDAQGMSYKDRLSFARANAEGKREERLVNEIIARESQSQHSENQFQSDQYNAAIDFISKNQGNDVDIQKYINRMADGDSKSRIQTMYMNMRSKSGEAGDKAISVIKKNKIMQFIDMDKKSKNKMFPTIDHVLAYAYENGLNDEDNIEEIEKYYQGGGIYGKIKLEDVYGIVKTLLGDEPDEINSKYPNLYNNVVDNWPLGEEPNSNKLTKIISRYLIGGGEVMRGETWDDDVPNYNEAVNEGAASDWMPDIDSKANEAAVNGLSGREKSVDIQDKHRSILYDGGAVTTDNRVRAYHKYVINEFPDDGWQPLPTQKEKANIVKYLKQKGGDASDENILAVLKYSMVGVKNDEWLPSVSENEQLKIIGMLNQLGSFDISIDDFPLLKKHYLLGIEVPKAELVDVYKRLFKKGDQ